MSVLRVVPVLAFLAVAAGGAQSHAISLPSTAIQIQDFDEGDAGKAPLLGSTTIRGTAVASCTFLFSGPSLDPTSTPLHIAGHATYAGSRTAAASTELSCAVRASGTWLGSKRLQLPGPASAVAGAIPVRSFGPFEICTMVNVKFTNGGESNPNEVYDCRPLTNVK